MKNILITGGSGFIGSNLALELQTRYPQANITVIDDFRGSSFKNLLGFLGDVMAYDVSDKSWMPHFKSKQLDGIFHLASITDTTVLDEKKMMFDNVEGFRNILDIAAEKKCPVVYASSAATYGSAGSTGPLTEADAGLPNNVYGFSKWVLENLARQYAASVKTVGLRFFNVFGPREFYKGKAASMIYQLYFQIKAGKRPRIFKFGEQKRDFVYVKDILSCTIAAREAKQSTVVNAGTGKPTSFNELIQYINEALGTSTEPEYFDNPYDFYQNFTQADMSHTEKVTGFKPRYTTREAVLEYVAYLEAHASAAKTAGV